MTDDSGYRHVRPPEEWTKVGNPDLTVPYTGTTSAEPTPPPPPEGYTLDQWIAERALRAQERLAAANDKLAEEMRIQRMNPPEIETKRWRR